MVYPESWRYACYGLWIHSFVTVLEPPDGQNSVVSVAGAGALGYEVAVLREEELDVSVHRPAGGGNRV